MSAPPASTTLLLLISLLGCGSASRDRGWVNDALVERTRHGFQDGSDSEVNWDDGLDEDEVVDVALAESPAYAADLARLRSAQADFDEAARLTNPRLSLQAPFGAIKAAASLVAPLLELFQLPRRKRAADRMVQSVAESLVQSGLDLIRDVRVAHIDAHLAVRRMDVLERLAETAAELATIAEARSDAGDVSPADALAVRADASVAADQVTLARRERTVAVAQLRVLLGQDAGPPLQVVMARPLPSATPDLRSLLRVARTSRPDVRAAELALESAALRAGWERSRVVNLSAQVDVQWDRSSGGARVGGALELPIFNQNQGGIGRAEAAIESARHRVRQLRQQVTLELVRANAALEQARASLERYTQEILPPLNDALDAATLRYELGDDSYLVVLDAFARLTNAQLREAELEADVRRAHAELERAAGARMEIMTETP